MGFEAHTRIGVASLHGKNNRNFQGWQNNLRLQLVSASKLAVWVSMSNRPHQLNHALRHKGMNRCSELQSQHAVRCRYSDGQNRQTQFADAPASASSRRTSTSAPRLDRSAFQQASYLRMQQLRMYAGKCVHPTQGHVSQSGQHLRFGHRLQVCGQFRRTTAPMTGCSQFPRTDAHVSGAAEFCSLANSLLSASLESLPVLWTVLDDHRGHYRVPRDNAFAIL